MEETLTRIAAIEILEDHHWETAARLMRKGQVGAEVLQVEIPLRAWRAFYNRHPERMRKSPRPSVQAIAAQLKAEDDAEAAVQAIDGLLARRGPP